jgi:hypothetical protein
VGAFFHFSVDGAQIVDHATEAMCQHIPFRTGGDLHGEIPFAQGVCRLRHFLNVADDVAERRGKSADLIAGYVVHLLVNVTGCYPGCGLSQLRHRDRNRPGN